MVRRYDGKYIITNLETLDNRDALNRCSTGYNLCKYRFLFNNIEQILSVSLENCSFIYLIEYYHL